MATSLPPESWTIEAIHSWKRRSKAPGSRRLKTSPRVSWEGMPWGRSRKVFSQASLALPYWATAAQPSAPQITAKRAMVRRSISLWRRLGLLGSGIVLKARGIFAVAWASMPKLLSKVRL